MKLNWFLIVLIVLEIKKSFAKHSIDIELSNTFNIDDLLVNQETKLCFYLKLNNINIESIT